MSSCEFTYPQLASSWSTDRILGRHRDGKTRLHGKEAVYLATFGPGTWNSGERFDSVQKKIAEDRGDWAALCSGTSEKVQGIGSGNDINPSICSNVLDRAVWPALGRPLGWDDEATGVMLGRSFDGYSYNMPPPLDLPSVLHNPPDYSATQSRYGLGQASAPAPAPAPRGGSAGPGRYGYPSTSARRTLTRQHRSMDTMGPLETNMGGTSQDGPLAIATNFPLHQNAGLHGTYRAPLSNPTSTSQNFWSNLGRMTHYSEAGGGSSSRLPGTLSLSAEYEQLKADYQASVDKLNQTMNSIKTFWSPELKRERQMRREVERLLQTAGTSSSAAQDAHLRMEIAARDEKIRQLNAMLDEGMSGGSGLAEMRVRELEDMVAQLQEMLKNQEQQVLGQVEPSGRFALENALRIADDRQARINELQEELSRLRVARAGQPRDFTDKSVTSHEMVTLRMKMERSEVELSERKAELAQCQARMRTAEEQAADLRQHVQLLKEQITNREQQHTLLQGDVDALRQKLEGKNQQMEQRDQRIERLEKDLASAKGEVSEKQEQIQQSDHRISQMMGRIDGLETSLRDKEAELDKAKIRLLSHPDVIKEKELRDKIESMSLEKQRLQDHIDQLRRNSEKERLEQQETYQTELRRLKCNVENLQKELADRDVLLESQNEKIGDMDRELASSRQRLQAVMIDKGEDELRKEVESARGEVEKLLKMVRQLEKENTQLSSQCKQLQSAIDRGGTESSGTLTKGEISAVSGSLLSGGMSAQAKKRIEELEEALRESVSITAEREVHLSQQKHLLHQVNQQLADARRENSELRKRVAEGGVGEREQLLRAVEAERRQHIEQLLQLKQEALLAAIAEKEAHIALLEKSRAPREEIETVRRHKEALMRKLKQENERRAMVIRPESAASIIQPGAATVSVGGPLPFLSQPSPRQGDIMTMSGEIDDSEGIWA
ncbi:hypothetical protein RB195_000623 [Necator americanus]|uniref:Uncharacterized protein n=1 Tax=Necator americanus TaxID=51031 RepID=A0ABR1DAS9_NECAM